MKLFAKKKTGDTPRMPRRGEPVRQPRLMQGQDDYSFRRSRTITGAVSSEVKAVSETAAQLKSPRLKEHELRQHRSRIITALLVIMSVTGLIYWLLIHFTARISAITYAPQPVVQEPAGNRYVEIIQRYLRERPLERFSFALDQSRLTAYVQQTQPEVARVQQQEDPIIGASNFKIILRTPVVRWRVQAKQYYVDAAGVSFESNAYAAPSVQIKDESGVALNETTGAIASRRFLGFVGRVVAATNRSGIGEVAQVVMPAGTARTIILGLKGKGYQIKMHIDRDSATQVEDARLALEYMQARGIVPQYVDVRVAHKAYYR